MGPDGVKPAPKSRAGPDASRHPPSVDAVLQTPQGADLVSRFGRPATVTAIRASIAAARAGRETATDANAIALDVGRRLEVESRPHLKAVFNLTGTVLHTNLGRAVLAEDAIEAAITAMRSAVALEYDLETGVRGERDNVVRTMLCELTGAEDVTIVNNNTAALLLTLNTLAKGRGVAVSRGELIEIGGAFRLPEIMRRAGAKLIEIGTTNRTHLRDYELALSEGARLILKVHTSNYRIEGFTAAVAAPELSLLARKGGVPLVNDLGSGTLVDLTRFGLPHEPTVKEAIADGADIVTFSGDKLLGGVQAGFIVGRRDLLARINRNPMKRALRVDKIRLAAIEATLRLYRDPDRLAERLPTFRLIARSGVEIEAQCHRLAAPVAAIVGERFSVDVASCSSQVGSGAVPLETLPSAALAIAPRQVRVRGRAIETLAARLRALPVPVIGRIRDGALLLDLRCLEDETTFLDNLADLAAADASAP